jgi:hypothetical protein
MYAGNQKEEEKQTESDFARRSLGEGGKRKRMRKAGVVNFDG